jgi:LysR family glycine cleavage system transcriptional activator
LVHPDLLKAFGPVRAPKDLLRMPLIELNIVPGLWERWFSKCDRKIAMPRLDLSSDSLLASIQLAEARVGAILAPFPLAASLVTSGRLTAPFKPVKLIDDPDFHLVYRKSEAGTAKIKAVRKWFKDIMEEFEHFPGRGDL